MTTDGTTRPLDQAAADAVERAARIIAATFADPYDWDELTDRWQEMCRDCARRVLTGGES